MTCIYREVVHIFSVCFPIDNTNFGSSSSITFPVLQRSAEEKVLNSDRLTLERWEGGRVHAPEPLAAVSDGLGLLGFVCVCFWEKYCGEILCVSLWWIYPYSSHLRQADFWSEQAVHVIAEEKLNKFNITNCEATSVGILVWSQHKTSR